MFIKRKACFWVGANSPFCSMGKQFGLSFEKQKKANNFRCLPLSGCDAFWLRVCFEIPCRVKKVAYTPLESPKFFNDSAAILSKFERHKPKNHSFLSPTGISKHTLTFSLDYNFFPRPILPL